MVDNVDIAQELEERHRAQALARIRLRKAAQAAQPPAPKPPAREDEA